MSLRSLARFKPVEGLALTGIAYAQLTSLIVLAAVSLDGQYLHGGLHSTDGTDAVSRCTNWDGQWFARVVNDGYQFSNSGPSSVAMFPAFPWLAKGVAVVTGLGTEAALLVVAHAALIGAFCVFGAYVARRFPDAPPELTDWTLLAFGLLPTTFFFRMAYSESLFVLVTLLVLLGIQRKWPVLAVAALVGLATATRSTGVALVPVLAWYAWRQTSGGWLGLSGAKAQSHDEEAGASLHSAPGTRHQSHDAETGASFHSTPGTPKPQSHDEEAGDSLHSAPGTRLNWLRRASYCGAVSIVGCWGLLAFMAFQWHAFGEPLAFVKTQQHWRLRIGEPVSTPRKLVALATLEPLWETYLPSRENYWANHDRHGNPLFSLQFANPIYFVGTIALVILGWRKKWLNDYELLLSAGLLLIPYLLKSHDSAMAGFGRFSAVVVPVYIVLGQILSRLGGPLAAALLAISAFFLGIYSALFAAWYRFI